jgi:tripartite ATP-independent transporter DctP family solute receptor
VPDRAHPLLLTLCCILLLGGGCGREQASTTLRLAHGLGVTHPVHLAFEELAGRVEALSAGRLRVEIHPAEQLCSERECLELLQIGSVAMTKVSASVMENFASGYRVLGLPYLFRDDAHRAAVLEGEIGRELLAEGAERRLLGLAFYDAGSRSFYTRDRPIREPVHLAGLKIRTQESPTAMAMVRALGGAPTPLSWGELYAALQQGVVDGAENNPPSFHLSGHCCPCTRRCCWRWRWSPPSRSYRCGCRVGWATSVTDERAPVEGTGR